MARASYCLDAFVELLDQAVRRAQQRCRQRHAAVVNAAAAACDMWAHCVDGEQTAQAETAPLFSIPVCQLRALRLQQISEFSLTLQVQIEPVTRTDGAPGLALRLAPPDGRTPGHTLKISYQGTERPRGVLWFDGVALKEWILHPFMDVPLSDPGELR
ncbi:hypothetical protein GUF72_13070 [Xanthomonas citri pv. citri]|uniref:Uncharacterized protein n=1 Tax=Xanthomonas citri pv. citri TaxID=611301 RepID=A0A0U5FDX7_XANCI|nr:MULTISPECIES: hypothetical protein [Xanthomonas]AGH77113.1 hypothetical protein XAC29_08115 [Xanthomonas axonopodis Xac29-1]AGI08493.1 Hypothetical Protein XCAW_02715 [Xanthomonas citri subsp. citri Aw12879]AJD68204.1 hypothetical protein J151_01761 [Xanthomonas citri subsp. citri A306]AJY81737.1 hypothetical protein J159_01757 [Xanthomonas citri pv. citri]AJY86159.1 hypothetical protein J158_01757 [Xanthomonas citri subsp. citri UI6]